MSNAGCEMPRYQCHKTVWAMKIQEVVKHALPIANATPEQDAAFEESPQFEGATLFLDPPTTIGVKADWYRKHNPQAGGYYVVYEDGYASYSPAAAFEAGYTRL